MEEKPAESQDGQVKVYLTRDGMEAYLTVQAPQGEGKPADMAEAMAALEKAGVTYGLDLTKVSEAIEKRNWDRTVLVARGTPPVHGEDGRIEYKFDVSKHTGPAETPDGKVDYRNLNQLCNVQRGQLLAVKIDATPGIPGKTVNGQPVAPRPGKQVSLRRGKNTVVDESGNHLYSTVDGHVFIADDRVVVEQVYVVEGDVDFGSGNVDFVGDVVVRGGITSGFTVKAGGDVEVGGLVEAAQVMAQGNIKVSKGITGGDKGIIQAKGNVVARFVENARVIAGAEVVISDAIIQSQVCAGRAVRVEGRKGTIVGGHIQARDEVSARIIGSPFATQTLLEVGVDPVLREEYRRLTREYLEKKKVFETVARNVQMMQQSTLPQHLTGKRRAAMVKLLEDYKSLKAELSEMEKHQAALEEEFNRMEGGKIKVYDVIYPGVRITMGKAVYIVNDPVKYAMFVVENGEIRVTSIA